MTPEELANVVSDTCSIDLAFKFIDEWAVDLTFIIEISNDAYLAQKCLLKIKQALAERDAEIADLKATIRRMAEWISEGSWFVSFSTPEKVLAHFSEEPNVGKTDSTESAEKGHDGEQE